MRELVIVIADLFVTQSAAAGPAARRPARGVTPEGGAFPGLAHATRFAEACAGNWRPWLTRWLGRPELSSAATASVAAASVDRERLPAASAWGDSRLAAWLATPLHLGVGMTTLHADFRSRLRVPPADLQSLARDFHHLFAGAELWLTPLDSGDLLLLRPGDCEVRTTEPARLPTAPIATCLPAGPGAPALRKLGAEIEMWLHGHPLNTAREQRGEATISTLWLWGGGAPFFCAPSGERAPGPGRSELPSAGVPRTDGTRPASVFAADAYSIGLCALTDRACRPLPQELAQLLDCAEVERAAVVCELAQLLSEQHGCSELQAIADLDRRFIAPAVQAVRGREIDTLTLLASDRRLTLRAGDHLKLWRRRRAGLEGLR